MPTKEWLARLLAATVERSLATARAPRAAGPPRRGLAACGAGALEASRRKASRC